METEVFVVEATNQSSTGLCGISSYLFKCISLILESFENSNNKVHLSGASLGRQ